jgi:hypothetical protein
MENHHKSIWNNKHIQQNNESRLEYKRTLSNDAMVDSKLKGETISESKRVFESRMTNASPLNSFNEVLQTFAHKTYKMAKSDSADNQEQLNTLKEAFNQNILMDAKEHFDRLHEFMDTNEKSIEIDEDYDYDCSSESDLEEHSSFDDDDSSDEEDARELMKTFKLKAFMDKVDAEADPDLYPNSQINLLFIQVFFRRLIQASIRTFIRTFIRLLFGRLFGRLFVGLFGRLFGRLFAVIAP